MIEIALELEEADRRARVERMAATVAENDVYACSTGSST